MNIEKALINPAKVFESPQSVCDESTLSTEQKVEILRRWEYDAREMQVAEEENMKGNSGDILDDVLAALNSIGADEHLEHSSPTKQGGE